MCLTLRSYPPSLYALGLTPHHKLTSGGLRSWYIGQPPTFVTCRDPNMLCSLYHDVHQLVNIVPCNDKL